MGMFLSCDRETLSSLYKMRPFVLLDDQYIEELVRVCACKYLGVNHYTFLPGNER